MTYDETITNRNRNPQPVQGPKQFLKCYTFLFVYQICSDTKSSLICYTCFERCFESRLEKGNVQVKRTRLKIKATLLVCPKNLDFRLRLVIFCMSSFLLLVITKSVIFIKIIFIIYERQYVNVNYGAKMHIIII